MTLQEWIAEVARVAGYNPDTSCCWGAEASASSLQLIIDDALTPGFPALSEEEARRLVGRPCRVERQGRYTRAYFGTLHAVEPAAQIGEHEPEDWA